MSEKTIREVSDATGISRFTLAQVAREGRFKASAHRSGTIWLIDMEHQDFKTWFEHHWKQARVKGSLRIDVDTFSRANAGSWVTASSGSVWSTTLSIDPDE